MKADGDDDHAAFVGSLSLGQMKEVTPDQRRELIDKINTREEQERHAHPKRSAEFNIQLVPTARAQREARGSQGAEDELDMRIDYDSIHRRSDRDSDDDDDASEGEDDLDRAYDARRHTLDVNDVDHDADDEACFRSKTFLAIVFVILVVCVVTMSALYVDRTHPGGLAGLLHHKDADGRETPSTETPTSVKDIAASPGGSHDEGAAAAVDNNDRSSSSSSSGNEQQQAAASTDGLAPPDTAPRGKLPGRCSPSHVAALTAAFFHSTPTEYIPWESLYTVGDVMTHTGGVFRTTLDYNRVSPYQTYEHICLTMDHKQDRPVAWVFTGSKEGDATAKPFDQETPEEQTNPTAFPDEVEAFLPEWAAADQGQQPGGGEGGRWRKKTWVYKWNLRRHPPPAWKYLPGTTTHFNFVYNQNFGHGLIDLVLPMKMLLEQGGTECANLAHVPQRVLVDVGCAEDPDEARRAGKSDVVLPMEAVSAPSTRWLVRLGAGVGDKWPAAPAFGGDASVDLTMYDAAHRPQPDGIGIPFVTLRHLNASAPEQCDSLPGLCFERLVVLGRQEDRENRACGGDGNRFARENVRRFREATFRAMQIPMPFLVRAPAKKPSSDAEQPASTSSQQGAAGVRAPRVLLYGREDGVRRKWLDVGLTKSLLDLLHSEGEITLTHTPTLSSLDMCAQVVLFSEADVILMPQGAGILASIWSPPGALILEIFPHGREGGSWMTQIQHTLDMELRHLNGVPAPTRPDLPTYRPNGQDDDFLLDPTQWMDEMERVGINVGKAREALEKVKLEEEQKKQQSEQQQQQQQQQQPPSEQQQSSNSVQPEQPVAPAATEVPAESSSTDTKSPPAESTSNTAAPPEPSETGPAPSPKDNTAPAEQPPSAPETAASVEQPTEQAAEPVKPTEVAPSDAAPTSSSIAVDEPNPAAPSPVSSEGQAKATTTVPPESAPSDSDSVPKSAEQSAGETGTPPAEAASTEKPTSVDAPSSATSESASQAASTESPEQSAGDTKQADTPVAADHAQTAATAA